MFSVKYTIYTIQIAPESIIPRMSYLSIKRVYTLFGVPISRSKLIKVIFTPDENIPDFRLILKERIKEDIAKLNISKDKIAINDKVYGDFDLS